MVDTNIKQEYRQKKLFAVERAWASWGAQHWQQLYWSGFFIQQLFWGGFCLIQISYCGGFSKIQRLYWGGFSISHHIVNLVAFKRLFPRVFCCYKYHSLVEIIYWRHPICVKIIQYASKLSKYHEHTDLVQLERFERNILKGISHYTFEVLHISQNMWWVSFLSGSWRPRVSWPAKAESSWPFQLSSTEPRLCSGLPGFFTAHSRNLVFTHLSPFRTSPTLPGWASQALQASPFSLEPSCLSLAFALFT